MIITYTADSEDITAILEALVDAELRMIVDVTDLVPELFPSMTVLLATAHMAARGTYNQTRRGNK